MRGALRLMLLLSRRGPTYAQFQAHIATLADKGAIAWGNWTDNGVGGYRTTAAAATGAMAGSSWNSSYEYVANSVVARIVQHGLPSQAVFDAQVAAGREIFLRVATTTPDAAVTGLARNGYTSTSNGAAVLRGLCTELIYWDGTQAQRMVPSSGTGPTPYTW